MNCLEAAGATGRQARQPSQRCSRRAGRGGCRTGASEAVTWRPRRVRRAASGRRPGSVGRAVHGRSGPESTRGSCVGRGLPLSSRASDSTAPRSEHPDDRLTAPSGWEMAQRPSYPSTHRRERDPQRLLQDGSGGPRCGLRVAPRLATDADDEAREGWAPVRFECRDERGKRTRTSPGSVDAEPAGQRPGRDGTPAGACIGRAASSAGEERHDGGAGLARAALGRLKGDAPRVVFPVKHRRPERNGRGQRPSVNRRTQPPSDVSASSPGRAAGLRPHPGGPRRSWPGITALAGTEGARGAAAPVRPSAGCHGVSRTGPTRDDRRGSTSARGRQPCDERARRREGAARESAAARGDGLGHR